MATIIKDIVTWLKQWYYTETEIDGMIETINSALANKVSKNLTNANMNVVTDSSGDITTEAKPTIPSDVSDLTDSTGVIPTDVSDLTDTTNKTFTPKSHAHGNVQNDGKLKVSGTVQTSKNVVTDSNGNITYENKDHKTGATTYGVGDANNYGHLKLDSSINSGGANPVTGGAIYTALSGKAASSHDHGIELIEDDDGDLYIQTTFNEQGVPVGDPVHLGAFLKELKDSVETLEAIDWLNIISSSEWSSTYEQNPSADTMNKLFIVIGSTTTDIYYTKQSGTGSSATYTWGHMDTDILDGLSIAWNDITGKPSFGTNHSDFAYGDHGHGNITTDGRLYVSSTFQTSKNVVTDAQGNITFENKDHSSTGTGYGAGTTTKYGHNKIIDALNKSTLTNGEALAAHQGYVLDQGKADKSAALGVTITLVDAGETNEGCIIFNTIS